MSKRATDAAWVLYPDYPSMDGGYVSQRNKRTLVMQGYEFAEKDLGWISVKDRLPEENKWVFVCVDMQDIPQCVGLGYLRNGEWCDDEDDNGFCVDYWMEIPALPKEEENG